MSASPAPPGFPRRRLLAGSAGLALLLAGCTSGGSGSEARETGAREAREREDRLAAQVPVQLGVVAAYDGAIGADAAFGETIADLAGQAQEQLARLRAAAPGASASPSSIPPAPPAGGDLRAWLREQVSAAASAHAAACVEVSGAAAALLGSLAAGPRGDTAAVT